MQTKLFATLYFLYYLGGDKVNRLLELRKQKKLTQREIAQKLHIHLSTYRAYESGKRPIPLTILVYLAFFYDVSTDYIIGFSDTPEHHEWRIFPPQV